MILGFLKSFDRLPKEICNFLGTLNSNIGTQILKDGEAILQYAYRLDNDPTLIVKDEDARLMLSEVHYVIESDCRKYHLVREVCRDRERCAHKSRVLG